MTNNTVFWINALVGSVTGLILMLVVAFAAAHAVLEWRAARDARRIGVADADALHVRLDALGRQIDGLERRLIAGAQLPDARPPEPGATRPAAVRARHPTPVS